MESSFVSFVKKPYRLGFSIFFSRCVLLCPLYFLPFSASYHLPFIFALILCFFFFLALDVILCNC